MKFRFTGLQAELQPKPKTSIPANQGNAGFTLLETLTALTILAFALVVLFQAHSTSLKAATASSSYTQARILAESLLAESRNGWTFPQDGRQGRYGKFTWSVSESSISAPWAPDPSKQKWQLNRIIVTVVWDKKRTFRLESLKLRRKNV